DVQAILLSAERCGSCWQCDCEIESVQARRSKGGRKSPDCAPDCAENQAGENGESVARSVGWGGRIRTSAWRNQNPTTFLLKSMHILRNSRNSSRYQSRA